MKEIERDSLTSLVDLVALLRSPEGCPWDQKQTLADLRAYLLEEAHETADAIDRGSKEDLCEELGDLLFQVAFITQLAGDNGWFSLGDIISGVRQKMIERHPHVFGDEVLADVEAVQQSWAQRKLHEKNDRESLLDGVPASLPALTAAFRLGQKAAGVGFDWPSKDPVWVKIKEEMEELESAGDDSQHQREELGDLLFAVVNLARHYRLDPEHALAATNLKFRRRFAFLEKEIKARENSWTDLDLEDMEDMWREAKALERSEPLP